MTILVRRGRPEDLPLVVQHYGRGDTPWDPFSDLGKLQRIPRQGLMIAEVNGEYAGFLYWFENNDPWFDPGVERYAVIEEVQVLERFRGRGVGKRLLGETLADPTLKRVDAIYVDTTEDNAVARRLYEGAGFSLLSRSLHYKLTEA